MTQTPIRRVRHAVLLALVVSSPFALRPAADQQGGGSQGLQPCAATDFTSPRLFDVLPLDLSGVTGIVPLGSVSPPSHILPVHVLYLFTPYTFVAGGEQLIPDEPDQPIRVPGDVTVTGVRWEKNSGSALIAGDDWYVNFRPCNEIRFTYHHLNAITGPPRLVARAAQIRRGVNAVCDVDESGEPVACTGIADVRLSAGDQVGTVFRLNQVSFNISATDHRAGSTNPPPPPGNAVDPARYELTYDQVVQFLTDAGRPIPREFTPELAEEMGQPRPQARCALDYFEPALRSALYARLGSFDGTTPRLVPPRCGQFFQDSLDGGLTGGWFPEDLMTPFPLGGEEIVVGFLYGNILPGRMYFSIGGSVAPALNHSITFPYPGFDDNVTWRNVSFAGARYQPALPSDGQPLYCWDGLGATTMIGSAASPPSPVPGVMLVQFDSPTQIRFEYAATQTCAARSLTPAAQIFVR